MSSTAAEPNPPAPAEIAATEPEPELEPEPDIETKPPPSDESPSRRVGGAPVEQVAMGPTPDERFPSEEELDAVPGQLWRISQAATRSCTPDRSRPRSAFMTD